MSILNVNKINPVGGGSTITITGIASVTGSISVASSVTAGSIHGNLTGDVTGSGANLTSLPSAQLTGTIADARFPATLPAVSGANLTNVSASSLSGNPSINTTGIVTATAFVPTVGQLSHRNIIVNGAMNVAQRGSTSTSQGYQTVDRFSTGNSGLDEAPTRQQVDVAVPSSPYNLPTSGAHPYKEGFRKAFYVQNGNQTSGAGAGDYLYIRYKVEAQDLANSGWLSTSASSYLTLSFWVKSSVAQNFYCRLESQDGTKRNYPFETGSLSAFTWTKITKTIPGNTSPTVDVDNNNGAGMEIHWEMFRGTDFTDNSVSNDTWATYASGTRTKDQTSTWYTTNDASFQITGVQLEVGPVATPFEHRSYGEELIRCKRYFNLVADGADARSGQGRSEGVIGNGFFWQSTRMMVPVKFDVRMRTPDWTLYKKNGEYRYYANGQSNQTCGQGDIGLNGQDGSIQASLNITNINSSSAAGMFFVHDANAALGFDAEL